MYRKILVPLDGSERAEAVLDYVCNFVGVNSSEIILLHVTEYPYDMYSECYKFPPDNPKLVQEIQNKKDAIQHKASEYLKKVESNYKKSDLMITSMVCEGPVVQIILDSIDSMQIDLIIMSARGYVRGDSKRIGAVTDRIFCEAKVPVMIIRTDSRDLRTEKFHNRMYSPNKIVRGDSWYQSIIQS